MVADPVKSQDYFASGATESAAGSKGAESGSVVDVASPAELDAIIKSGKKVVVQFSATWCGKCKQIAPTVENLAIDNEDVTFVKVDKDLKGFESIVKDWKVEALPSFRFFKNGKEASKEIAGYKQKLLKQAVEEL
jgi:thioredoxin 1